MGKLERIESGTWQRAPDMVDYRAEWLTDVLVERATCGAEIRPLVVVEGGLRAPVVAQAGAVWTRFWFRREGWLIEKYFAPSGRIMGFYAPICGAIEYNSGYLATDWYGLALWISEKWRVTVLGEQNFEQASATGIMPPVAEEQAEQRIRELTTLTAQRRFPPAFVRNFGIMTKSSEP
jgi:hypothetical protein